MKRHTLIRILTVLLITGIGAGGGYWFAMRRMHAEVSVPPAASAESPAMAPVDKTETATDRSSEH